MKNLTRILGAALTVLATACSQDAVSPTVPAVSASATSNAATGPSLQNARGLFESDTHVGTQTQGVLMFAQSVNPNVEARQVIGPLGGVLRLPETGLTLIVPPGAVLVPTEFRAKANNSRLVAYDFAPHGTQFRVPLIYQQDLSRTNYRPGMILGGAYYVDPTKLDITKGVATTAEQYSVQLNPLGFVIFTLKHFSGYLVSCA